MQFGIGNKANAVLAAMCEHPDIPPFEMFSEVVQDSVIAEMEAERIKFASATAIAVSPKVLERVYGNLGFFKEKIVLRPQEISNHPEVVRRLGVIAVNTALEADLMGNVNSTHVMGTQMMNGIGGSGDFTRHSALSIFTCSSIVKDGKVSPIVPLVTHMDHSEHSVHVIVTENGTADLRCKGPYERARLIIENCVHDDYKEELRDYLRVMEKGHEPERLKIAFGMHDQCMETGDMRGVDWRARLGK